MSFLGIKINSQIGRLLSNIDVPGENTSIEDYHITILCFEDNFNISDAAKALEVTHKIVNKTKPFSIELNKVTCFPKREDNPCPIIMKVKSKELQKLHDQLAKEFDDANIEFKKTFSNYTPHVTLSYADDEIEDLSIDPIELQITELILWCGDNGLNNNIYITFPLPAQTKHATLINKVNLFYKLCK